MHFRCRVCAERVTRVFDAVAYARAGGGVLDDNVAIHDVSPLTGHAAWRLGLGALDDGAVILPTAIGCCGPTGLEPNVACAADHVVGNYANDCTSPSVELALDPSAVVLCDHDDVVEPLLGVFRGAEASAFVAWLHEVFHLDGWYGDDLYALLAAWARAPVGGLILWSGADRTSAEVIEIVDAFTALEHHAPRARLLVPR